MSTVSEIKERGWYSREQTFLEGELKRLYEFATDWKRFQIWIDEDVEPVMTITAKDDNTAIAAFNHLFYLDKCGYYCIEEKIVRYRVVESSDPTENPRATDEELEPYATEGGA